MKKHIITAAFCGLTALGVTSCDTWLGTAVQQVYGMMDVETSTMSVVYQVIQKHPDSIDLFKKVSTSLVKLSEKDVLTLGDVEADIKKKIEDSDLPFKSEIIFALEKAFSYISTDKEFDIANNKEEILKVASGIDWAIRFYNEKHPLTIETTVTK